MTEGLGSGQKFGEASGPTPAQGATRDAAESRLAATTAGRTIVPGAVADGGWRELIVAPGTPHVGAAPAGDVLAAIVHLSDLHLCDAESTARQEYLDRHGDPGEPYAPVLGDIGTYRPQEILTVHVAVSALATVAGLEVAPVTGAPLDAVLVTGDVTDNAQRNELSWYSSIMAGGTVAARSGDPAHSSWVGAADQEWSDRYWHPDGAVDGQVDRPIARFGYPTVPGLVEAARQPLTAAGSSLPWYGVHGNHDALLQGVVAPDARLRALATGGARVTDLAPGQTPYVALEGAAQIGPADYTHTTASPTTPVAADPERDFVSAGDFDDAHHVAAQHGGTRVAGDGNAWACDIGELRVIAIDTVNPHGGWQGSLDDNQLAWLEQQIIAAGQRYVVITSHHPSWTLTNPYAPDGSPQRHRADAVLALLLRYPKVIAWLAGHVHANVSAWHAAPDGSGSGLWEVTTSSLIDWPQQFRVVEVVREPGGTIAIASTVVDHAGPASWSVDALGDPAGVAALSRALAVNDYRVRQRPERLLRSAGRDEDRNVVWRMVDPLR